MQHVVPLRESAEGLHFGNGDMRAGVVLVAIFATPILVAFIVLMLSISGVGAAIILAAVAIGVGLPIAVASLVVPRASVLRSDGTLLQMPRFRKRYAESAGAPSFVRLRELETPEAKFFYVSLAGSLGHLELCSSLNRRQAELWASQIAAFLGVQFQSTLSPGQ